MNELDLMNSSYFYYLNYHQVFNYNIIISIDIYINTYY